MRRDPLICHPLSFSAFWVGDVVGCATKDAGITKELNRLHSWIWQRLDALGKFIWEHLAKLYALFFKIGSLQLISTSPTKFTANKTTHTSTTSTLSGHRTYFFSCLPKKKGGHCCVFSLAWCPRSSASSCTSRTWVREDRTVQSWNKEIRVRTQTGQNLDPVHSKSFNHH